MYFYIHKIYKHENEQAQLLEVCNNACFHFRNGKYFQGLTIITFLNKRLQIEMSATFFIIYIKEQKHDK